MNPKITLSIAILLLLAFFTLHISVSRYILQQPRPDTMTAPSNIPQFASIENIQQRKRAFFDYLTPYIVSENDKIKELRRYVRKQNTQIPSAQIKQLAIRYRIQANDPQLKQSLLAKIDTLPASLVLSQAAIESAWGTSRFATQGYNFFGQWCFTPGCGIVPSQRPHGSHHEVERFTSPAQSVASYLKNLNSHPAYKILRDNRITLRKSNDTLNGCFLAEGLVDYSAKKQAYIESLKQLMRVNQLEDKQSIYCQKQAAIETLPTASPTQPSTPEV